MPWFAVLRSVLEALYFLSSIAIAVAAFKGLHQLRLTREQLELTRKLADEANQREAFKLAAEQCHYFGERVVPLSEAARADCREKKITIFGNLPFKVRSGEIIEHKFPNSQAIYMEFSKVYGTVVPLLNSIEAFSIFFQSSLADDTIGYRECGQYFCEIVRTYMPGIYYNRVNKNGRWECTINLFERWAVRQLSEELIKAQQSIETQMQAIKPPGIK